MTQPQDGIDWNDPRFGGAGGTGGDGDPPSYPKDRVVRTLGHLQALIPDYEGRTIADIIASPLFSGPNAYTFDPRFYKQLQTVMLTIEKQYGVPPSQIPAGVLGSTTQLKQLLDCAGGSGTDHYATDVSALINQMNARLDYWEQQIANVDSGVTHAAGKAGFEADWQKLVNDFNTTQATLQQNADDLRARLEDAAKERQISDVSIREREEANRKVSVAQEAGQRASTITGDVLPRFVSGNAPINVPSLGPVRGAQVNFAELFNQGGAGNLAALPSIAPQFAGGYAPTPVSAPPQLPPLGPRPAYPGAPVYPGAPSALLSWLGMS